MSGYAVSETSRLFEDKSRASVPEKTQVLNGAARARKEEPSSTLKSEKNKKYLPTLYKDKNISVVGASQLLADNYPTSYSPENYQKAITELKVVTKGILAFLFLIYMTWVAVEKTNFTESGELIYNSGLVGGSLMLVALIYAIFKRSKKLRRVLSSDVWYYIHIACGAVGAFLVIFHSLFDLRSINGSVAFVTTLVVIISGALGRYLFTLSTISLHRQYVDIRETENNLFELINKYDDDGSLRIQERLSKFALHCFKKPKSIVRYFMRWISVIYYGVYYYLLSRRDLRKIATSMAKTVTLDKKDLAILKKYHRRQLRHYILDIIVMGYTSLVEQVLRHWRVLHIPALYILTVTAIVHVVVIHMY